ncbi:hypothetical protein BDW74DRAFT_112179 [Aspergillus multicolor]|uniref:uncharacterized protein n=1 Tax=Aspergillus multicolor TaxID=41759 RepID=UPI003CCE43FD
MTSAYCIVRSGQHKKKKQKKNTRTARARIEPATSVNLSSKSYTRPRKRVKTTFMGTTMGSLGRPLPDRQVPTLTIKATWPNIKYYVWTSSLPPKIMFDYLSLHRGSEVGLALKPNQSFILACPDSMDYVVQSRCRQSLERARILVLNLPWLSSPRGLLPVNSTPSAPRQLMQSLPYTIWYPSPNIAGSL